MNKIHRIVWNKARKALMVVGENARTAGKAGGGQTTVDRLTAPLAGASAAALALMGLAAPPCAFAQTVIAPDGRTATTVTRTGPVYGVSTTTTSGSNAFNSFSSFTVGSGHTVNLQVPSSADNLINIVTSQRLDVNGVLNAIKNGEIGGKVWFADPHGFLVGASGVVNVGSLMVSTPSQAFVDGFFSAPGTPRADAVTQLLDGTAPRNSAGAVSVQGRINAIDGVRLSAGAIDVGGAIFSGARFVSSAPDFTSVVNTTGLASGTSIVASGGRIEIVADGDVLITAQSNGGNAAINVDGATVKGNNVRLAATSSHDDAQTALQVPVVGAHVTVNASRLEATGGDLSLSATTHVNATTAGLSPLASVTAVSTATVDVGGTTALISGAATRLAAASTVTTNATSAAPDAARLPGDAGAALNVVVSTATVHLGGGSSVDAGGALGVTAHNAVTAVATSDPSAGGAVASGGAVALTEVTSVTRAAIDGAAAVTRSSSLTIAADSANTVTTTAKAAPQGASPQSAAQAEAHPSRTESTLARYKDQASTAEGRVEVAAAVAVANVNGITEATLGSSGLVTSTGKAEVTSTAHNAATVSADGSSADGGTGVGTAVALNIGVLTNQARIADNARLAANGLVVSAGMPTQATNKLVTTAKSGAGAANVGVAGALAANVLVNTTSATLEGDKDASGLGASVEAGSGDIKVAAQNTSSSKLTSGADVKGSGDAAQVGVGASVGLNVAVNTTTAEVKDGAKLTGGKDMALDATANHTLDTEVTGGAAGTKTAVTPLAAVTVAVNTTTARLGTSATGLTLSGGYGSTADQTSSATTKAAGQTEGRDVAVGASLALGISTDTVTAEIDRNITAAADIGVNAKSGAKSSSSATASVKGGEKADGASDKPASGDAGTVDKQVEAQAEAAKKAGAAADAEAGARLKKSEAAPKTDSNAGGAVSVAAAVAANVEVATTTARVGKGRAVVTPGAVTVTSQAQTDAKADADGSQVDNAKGKVGVGAAVALDVGVASNVAVIDDNASVTANGVTVSATMREVGDDKTSDFTASAKSGAGAANVGVAGSLAINAAVDTTVAGIAGDVDGNGAGAVVDAGTGDVRVEARKAATSTVTSGAEVKGSGTSARVGVGASVGLDVTADTTVAEIGDRARLLNGRNLTVNADTDDAVSTDVTGGAASAKVTVTPVAAVSVVTDTTVARLGTGPALRLRGDHASNATQKSNVTTKATGTTDGSSVAVGASLALGIVVDTVDAGIERDLTAAGKVGINASSRAGSSTTATASVKGGEKADADDQPTRSDGSAGKTADEQVDAQAGAAAKAGAPAKAAAADQVPVKTTKPDTAKPATPKAETKDGAVSVAAAIGVDVAVSATSARIGAGRTIRANGGTVAVTSQAQTDGKASADGSQVDSGGTHVGVGAAVALNVGVASNTATIGDDADVHGQGITVSAAMREDGTDKASDFEASAKSGAGAGNVGVAGSLAVNAVVVATAAGFAGDENGSGLGARVAAGGGDVLIDAGNATTNKVTAGADVKGSGTSAKVGVGASVGVNVAVDSTSATVGDKASLTGARGLSLAANGDNTLTTEVTGGASGAKVAITPVVAAGIAVNSTAAGIGTSATPLDLGGALSIQATGKDVLTTKATGQAEGDVAVGASLAVAVGVDSVTADLHRNVASAAGVDAQATSTASLTTNATAGAKGAKPAKKDASGKDDPDKGTSVDDQKQDQLAFAKGRNSQTTHLDTDKVMPAAQTPDVNKNDTPSVDATSDPKGPTGGKEKGTKVSVAAAIGVGIAVNQAAATIGPRVQVSTTGNVGLKATTGTNDATAASGEAVSDDVGVAAAVALTAAVNSTQARLASGSAILQARDVEVTATSTQNRDAAFLTALGAKALSGASGGDVAVAGALAVVGNDNTTEASIDEGATVQAAGDVSVKADDTSKVAVQARAGALSKGGQSKAGVGASFAVALSHNTIGAIVGDGAEITGARSLTVAATRHPVTFNPLPNIGDVKSFSFDTLDPATYLGSNNVYTEAVAGAAAKGSAAVAGAFSVDLFTDTTEARLGQNVTVTTTGRQPQAVPGTPNAETLGVDVVARSDINAISFAGAVAGAKKAGVGVSNTDIGNFDRTLASIGDGSAIRSQGADAGVRVSASARQDLANVSVSAAGATGNAGVAGVLGVIVSDNEVAASIGRRATIASEADVRVLAVNDTSTVMVAGGLAGGKDVGVGGAIAANVLWNTTTADIGSGTAIDARKTVDIAADATEAATTAVVAGAGGGKAGVAAALSLNAVFTDTGATVAQGARINTHDAFRAPGQAVDIDATDDTTIVGIAGGGAGGGKAGVGAALDTAVLVKTVKAAIADGVAADGTEVDATRQVSVNAASSEHIVSVAAGFAGGGSVGVGGAVSIGIVDNDVAAHVGDAARVTSAGNVLVNAEDAIAAELTAVGAAGAGDVGVGGSLAVATLVGSTRAGIGHGAAITALGSGAAAQVYTGETGRAKEAAKGLSVTAYGSEDLITTVASGAGGGQAGVAATVSGNVVAQTTEASIGRGTQVNEDNTGAGADQQVRVKAVDETTLVDTAAGAGGGGSAGVGAAANVGVIAKTTTAWIGKATAVNAARAVDVQATAAETSTSTTAGFAGGGSAGVGGALAGVGVADTTEASIEDGTSAADAAKVTVRGGDLEVRARDVATTTLITGAGAGGGTAGVGASLSVGVNASTTTARIGAYADTNATGTTTVAADAAQNVKAVTIAGAGGGTAGVAAAVSVNVVTSHTEAGIGEHARVNQDTAFADAAQNVLVEASDTIATVDANVGGAGGGSVGAGGAFDVTYVAATTSAFIGNGAAVKAHGNVGVQATSDTYVNSATVAGGGGGAAGVGASVSVVAVGSLFDDQATSGLGGQQNAADGQGKASFVTADEGGRKTHLLGTSTPSTQAAATLDANTSRLVVGGTLGNQDRIPPKHTQAVIGADARVDAGGNVDVAATDKTLAIVAAGAGAGGGAAGISGSFGVVLLHDAAEASVADGARVNAAGVTGVHATTGEDVFNVGITGSGAGVADVSASAAVNVVTSQTTASVGKARINQDSAGQSVAIGADSGSTIVTVAGNGGGSGAASVGGVLAVNVLDKRTQASIGDGAQVSSQDTTAVTAASRENVVSGALVVHGAGAAAVGVAASANVVTDTTEARIGQRARVDSQGNVSLAATDDTLIVAVSGAGNGAGAAAVGGDAGANVIGNTTRAYVDDGATVNARGHAAGMAVFDGSVGAATAMPAVAHAPGTSAADTRVDTNGDGVADGDVGNGLSLTLSDGSGKSNHLDPANPDSMGLGAPSVSGATGGIGAKGTQSGVKGLSIVAVGNEKVISGAISVAGAGAAAVTGAAVADIVTSTTEAWIGDRATINDASQTGTDQAVRLTAADTTQLVQAAGTIAGGAVGVSGAANVAVVSKHTHARVGQSTIAASDLAVDARSTDDLHLIGANLSVGAVGAGGAVNVAVVTNDTTARIAAGAHVDASGDLSVTAREATAVDLYTLGIAGGGVGISGAVSVAVVNNTTQAVVDGAASQADAATLDAGGTTHIGAVSREDVTTVTVSGAGGGVGLAGAVGVRVVKSDTEASIGAFTRINQNRSVAGQDVAVDATDTVTLRGDGGSGALGGFVGGGAVAEIDIVRTTTAARLGDDVAAQAGRDIDVTAASTKDIRTSATALAGAGSVGVAGAVSLAVVGAALDGEGQGNIGSGATAAKVDTAVSTDKVGGNLGSSEHVRGAKADIATRTGGLGVAGDIDSDSADSQDKTRASIGQRATLSAGGAVDIAATDRTQLGLQATGAGIGAVGGIGGGVGIGLTNSTTEAFADGSAALSATGNVTVEAVAQNVDAKGSTVQGHAGGAGFIGASAAVAVLEDTSTTSAYLAGGSRVDKAAALTVQASTDRQSQTDAIGATAGGLAVGASVSRVSFAGHTGASIDGGAHVGQPGPDRQVGTVDVDALDTSAAVANATAGAAGIVAGSGAAADASVTSKVDAHLGDHVVLLANEDADVIGTSRAGASASAIGVNAGAAAVGVSLATAALAPDVVAHVGSDSTITVRRLGVTALVTPPAGGTAASAYSLAASGGLLGVSGASSAASDDAKATSSIGDRSTINGSVDVLAQTDTGQSATATGVSIGVFFAAGADIAAARSNTRTHASLGNDVQISADAVSGSVSVIAMGTDANFASATAGSGGIVAGAAAKSDTTSTSDTKASIGPQTCDPKLLTCGIAGGTHFALIASHDSIYNGQADSTAASALGASGGSSTHHVTSTVDTEIGDSVKVDASHIAVAANNASHKCWLGQGCDADDPAKADAAGWNLYAGAGGIAGGAAGSTTTTITQTTTVGVAPSVMFHVLQPALGTGSFAIDANDTIIAFDKVKLDAGGAIAVAEADAFIDAASTESVTVGKGTAIVSASGDVNIGTRANVALDARASANAYGLAGAPAGKAHVNHTGNTTVEVGPGVVIVAEDRDHGAINISAGRDSAGDPSSLVAHAAVNLWNKTVVPINSTPDAQSHVSSDASLTLAGHGADDPGSSILLAAGDIGLAADKGRISQAAVGTGKDLYRETAEAIANFFGADVSLDITGGSTSLKGHSTVTEDGLALSGLYRESATQFNGTPVVDGQPAWKLSWSPYRDPDYRNPNPLDTSNPYHYLTSVTPASVDTLPYSAQLQQRINDLAALAAVYSADPVAAAAYNAEITFLQSKLGPLGAGQKSGTLSDRAAAAATYLGNVSSVIASNQAAVTGDIVASSAAAQQGAVGLILAAFDTRIKPNNDAIGAALLSEKNVPATPSANADYLALTTDLHNVDPLNPDSSVSRIRTGVASIGNFAYACPTTACSTAPYGALGTPLDSSVAGGLRTVAGSGALGFIQSDMQTIGAILTGGTSSTQGGRITSSVRDVQVQLGRIQASDQAIAGALYNSASPGDVSTLYGALADASARQATLRDAWKDTAVSGNVDKDRVDGITARVASNRETLAEVLTGTNTVLTKTEALVSALGKQGSLQADLAAVESAADAVSQQSQKVVTLAPIAVKLGNVSVHADALTGSGSLQAPGDGKIIIRNNSPAILNVGALTVDDSGGNVTFNGFPVNSAADVQAVNAGRAAASLDIVSRANGKSGADRVAGAPGVAVVQVGSYYDPGAFDKTSDTPEQRIPAPAPDIHITDAIANPNGSVTISSLAGDIYIDPQTARSPGGSIAAGSVSITAMNGDYVQSYKDGFTSTAGEPYGNGQGGSNNVGGEVSGRGVLANGNVFISARYLNINGLVQSGIADHHLDLGTDADLRFVPAKQPIGYSNAGYIGQVHTWNTGDQVVTWNGIYKDIDGNAGRWEVNKAYVDANEEAGKHVKVAVETSGGSGVRAPGYPDPGAIQAEYIVPQAGQVGQIVMTTSAAVHGGSISLFGQIINTAPGGSLGGGQLNVLDGFGRIAITNNSSLPITLKSLDTGADPSGTGRGTAGVIRLTDLQYVSSVPVFKDAEGNVVLDSQGKPTLLGYESTPHYIQTTITRNNGNVTYEQLGAWVKDGAGRAVFDDEMRFSQLSGNTAGVGENGLGSAVSITGSRSGAYLPQAGLRYAYQKGFTQQTTKQWVYSGTEFFASDSLAFAPSKTSMSEISSETTPLKPTDKNGVYLSYAAPSDKFLPHANNIATDSGFAGAASGGNVEGTARADTSTAGTPAGSVVSTTLHFTNKDSWQLLNQSKSCDWWFACITWTYTSTWQENIGTATITTSSVRADNPIGIAFIGQDTPSVSVNSKSSIVLSGAINNRGGSTVLTAGVATDAIAADRSTVAIGGQGGQSITYEAGSAAPITTGKVDLEATGSIGGVTFAHQAGTAASVGSIVDTAPILLAMTPAISVAGGVISSSPSTLTASARDGNVVLKAIGAPLTATTAGAATTVSAGPLALDSITADGRPDQGTGLVLLEAQGDIVGASPTSHVKGERIELTSNLGGIGGGSGIVAPSPLVIEPGYSSDAGIQAYYGLKASAQGDIHLSVQGNGGDNPRGNLLVDTVVSSRDVHIKAPGQIIDNNPIQSMDTRTWNQLVNFWNSMQLVAGDDNSLKVQQAEAAYQRGVNQDYRLYWQIRRRQVDPGAYDPDFRYTVTPEEDKALRATGMTDADIASFVANRTAQYRQLNAKVGALNGGSYAADFNYVLSPADKKTIEETSTWTYSELGVSIPGPLKNITNTNPIVKAPNVSGRNVSLDAGVSLGKTMAERVVPIAAINACSQASCLTDAEKVALAAAEFSDLSFTPSAISVQQRAPLNFAASQSLSVAVGGTDPANRMDNGNAYLASLGDGHLNAIQAPGEVRVKVRGSIVNAGPDAITAPGRIEAAGLILEAANGGIGYVPNALGGATSLVQPLQLSLDDSAAFTARAGSDIHLQQNGDLDVASLYTPHNATVQATGSIVEHVPDAQLKMLAGEALTLRALDGSIGSIANPLDVAVNPTGTIVAWARSATPGWGGVYLNNPNGSFNIATVTASDAIKLTSGSDMRIDGAVTAPGPIQLIAGGTMTMTKNADVHANVLGAFLDAGTLAMADGARLTVDVGPIDIVTDGDAVVTGIVGGNPTASAVRVTSQNGRILAGHAAGTDHIDVQADGGPSATLTLTAARGIGDEPLQLQVAHLAATSGGVADLALVGPVTLDSIVAADRVQLTATGAITGNAVTSTGAGTGADRSVSVTSTGGSVDLATVSGTGDVSVAGSGGVRVGTIVAGTGLRLAGPTIQARVNGGSIPITGAITGFGGGSASDVDLVLSGAGGFAFDRFMAADAAVDIPLGALWVDDMRIGHRAIVTNPRTRLLVDQHNRSPQGFDVQLYSGGNPFHLGLAGNRVTTNSFVIDRDKDHETITPDGNNTSAVERAEQALALVKAVPTVADDGRVAKTVRRLVTFDGIPVATDCKQPKDCPP